MTTKQTKFLVKRIMDTANESGTIIPFVSAILDTDLDAAINEFKETYKSFLFLNLYPNKKLKPEVLQDMYFEYEDGTSLHMVVDGTNALVHCNSNTKETISAGIKRLFENGHIVIDRTKDFEKPTNIFKFEKYKVVAVDLPNYPMVYS